MEFDCEIRSNDPYIFNGFRNVTQAASLIDEFILLVGVYHNSDLKNRLRFYDQVSIERLDKCIKYLECSLMRENSLRRAILGHVRFLRRKITFEEMLSYAAQEAKKSLERNRKEERSSISGFIGEDESF
ncbi:hypothetical protein MHLP_02885 [Candidatus Mycoplasma haematolamae str. Purdue]|uniref:Uncharacterized protein n=1 Tax=Mycoplasma haematolamae (strain Purdue) TaxID=1212765 RepID=I7C6K7_MYCHA|nr:hypothetical protein [Candidatus Mycoplasma haematolamae]AFO52157.1 hypothetical protein MHLP_02885 [Candidatus Mycoplasma haematolamae str. Purdue]